MTAEQTLERLAAIGVLPVIEIDDADRADALADALISGGVACAEITFRTPAAAQAIAALAARTDFIVGAGTVLATHDVDRAVDAGAAFSVSPGFDERVVARAATRGHLLIPGVATASDVMRARGAGLLVQKLFPAAALGGAAAVSAFSGPFADVRFVPSGGVTPDTAASYRGLAVHALSTSWIAPRASIAAGDFAGIAERAALMREAANA